MPRLQGVGPRIAARIIEMGLARPDGKPDVRRFARRFDYDKTVVYEWIADRRTPTRDVARLCADLQVSHGYLLYGEGQPDPYKPLAAIAGGSGSAQLHARHDIIQTAAQAFNYIEDAVLLIRLRLGEWAWPLLLQWCPA